MTKLKIIIFMLSMLLATTGAMAQSRQSSKSRSRSSSTQKRSGNWNRSGNQNRYRNQNRSRQSSSLCPDNNHPHMIDLGLPSGTKWACCNVDADKPEAYGGYYAWGETEDFQDDVDYGYDIAGTQYDVAHWKWGGGWQMPTAEQIEELLDNCTYNWTTFNGVKGGKFTSKQNGKSIFLPAAGNRWGDHRVAVGSNGRYWSSTLYPSDLEWAYHLNFDSGGVNGNDRSYLFAGLLYRVRPVSK